MVEDANTHSHSCNKSRGEDTRGKFMQKCITGIECLLMEEESCLIWEKMRVETKEKSRNDLITAKE